MVQFKSKQRVTDHGEVFTPQWLVDEMLDQLPAEMDRPESRILETACGPGIFLSSTLGRKLDSVHARYGKSSFERGHQGLRALMSIYGIDLLQDNVEECRASLLMTFQNWLLQGQEIFAAAASIVLSLNIVQGDALSMRGTDGSGLVFSEWAYIGRGIFLRRDFQFEQLAQKSLFGEGTLFEGLDTEEVFGALKDHGQLTVAEIVESGRS